MPTTDNNATIGGAVLLANGPDGWQPGALLLTSPLVLLRYRKGVVQLFAASGGEPFMTSERNPLDVLDEVLAAIKKHVPAAGPKAGKPAFPLAMIAAAYEFGQRFDPHQDAFAHGAKFEEDEFFAAVFIDAYRPSTNEGTERIGYVGTIPADWLPGAPELQTPDYGHDAAPIVPHAFSPAEPAKPLSPTMDYDTYRVKVERIMEYLAAGDIYQANLTVPFSGMSSIPPEAVFDNALKHGGAAYSAMFQTPGGTILSFSPELYIRRRGNEIETRPIKGTRHIHNRMGGAAEAAEELSKSAKDRAEHIMIVDLERNDLGRVCKEGSVAPDPLMKPVEHPGVMHLESAVKGELRGGLAMRDIFAATYPGGSVTGAPKKRALEILSELETGPRGYYCGALGWIDCDGDCELNLPIRTAFIRPDGTVEYHAGGGIVADSTAEDEWEEIEVKTKFLRDILA